MDNNTKLPQIYYKEQSRQVCLFLKFKCQWRGSNPLNSLSLSCCLLHISTSEYHKGLCTGLAVRGRCEHNGMLSINPARGAATSLYSTQSGIYHLLFAGQMGLIGPVSHIYISRSSGWTVS